MYMAYLAQRSQQKVSLKHPKRHHKSQHPSHSRQIPNILVQGIQALGFGKIPLIVTYSDYIHIVANLSKVGRTLS